MAKLLPFEYAVRNLRRVPSRTLLGLTGATLVVFLVVVAVSFVVGMEASLTFTGSEDNVIILGAGSEESLERSQISAQAASVAAASIPGIRTRLGIPYVSPEVHMALVVKDKRDSEGTLGIIRGITAAAYLVHPQVKLIEGRTPVAGRDEVMVGSLVGAKLGVDEKALRVGGTLWFDDRPWTIAGRFEAPHNVMDAEIWCPLTDLQVLSQRDTTLSCVVLTLDPRRGDFADVQVFAAQRLDLEITALREVDYYRKLADFFAPIRWLVIATAVLIAAGGVLGGLNTMYASFAARVREVGMLQVLGFGRVAVVAALMEESLLLASAGAIVAAGAGLLWLDGIAIRFSLGAFGLVVDARVLAAGLAAGVALGLVGALPPAYRALRLDVTEALKA